MEIMAYNKLKPIHGNVYQRQHTRHKQKNQTFQSIQFPDQLLATNIKLINCYDLCPDSRLLRPIDPSEFQTAITSFRKFNPKDSPFKQPPSCFMPVKNLKKRFDKTKQKPDISEKTGAIDVISFEKIQVHLDMFDELIKECTLSSRKQGALLIHIRNEIIHQFQGYQNIFASVIAVAWKKHFKRLESEKIMREKIRAIKEDIAKLRDGQPEFERQTIRYGQEVAQHEIQQTQEYNEVLEPLLAKKETLKRLLTSSVKRPLVHEETVLDED